MRRSMSLRSAVAAVSLGAMVAVSACSGGAPAHAQPDKLRPGRLLTHSALTTAAALPSAKSTQLITYMSDDSHGQPIVVSGTVAVPKSPPPPGGYPVISWAHGTSGYADICAPSEDRLDGPDHDYFATVDPTLDAWVAQGYAVVQTDYQGLGTPGGHPYMNGISAANTVTDIVRAARELNKSIGSNWMVMGHSQGGQAALFAAEYAPKRAPELHLKGAVAIAPGGPGLAGTVQYVKAGGPQARAAEAFIPLLLLGAQAADPQIDASNLVSDAAQPMLTTAQTGCLAQIREAKTVPPKEFFRPGANLAPLTAYLAKQDPTGTTPKVPVMVAQGTKDTTVAKPGTDALVKKFCAAGPVYYRLYPTDHRGAVPASLPDAETFTSLVMSGKAAPNTCV